MSERLYLRLEGDPLYAPETTVPAGTMTELSIGELLRGHVAHVAAYRETIPEGHEVSERVLPDGAVRIMFNLGDAVAEGASAGPNVVVAGASARPVSLRLRGRLAGVTVTLRPGAVESVLGVPARAIADQTIALDELWRDGATELLEQVVEAPDDRTRLARVRRALERRARHDDDRRRAQRAVELVFASGGQRSIGEVAQALGVGERRLQQLFHTQVGLTPRALRRVARLHACVRALRAFDSPRWAEVAVGAGFYDQAHLVNEFKALSGLTPGAFFRRTVSGSSKTRA